MARTIERILTCLHQAGIGLLRRTFTRDTHTKQLENSYNYAQHEISISLRHLKRVLRNLGLRRRNPLTRRRLLAIIEAISVSIVI